MESWPSSFPLPNTNLAGDVADSTIRTTMDSGRIRQRPRFTQEQRFVNVAWSLTDIQFAVFDGFHKERLNKGADWFNINLPLGNGVQAQKARFVGGKFKHSYDAHEHWIVTAQLEIENKVQLASEVLDVYLEIGFSDIEIENFLDAIDDAYDVTHITLPTLLLN